MEQLIAYYQQGLEQAKGSLLETTYQIIINELQAKRDLLTIKNRLHVLELTSFDKKQEVLSEARHKVENLLWK